MLKCWSTKKWKYIRLCVESQEILSMIKINFLSIEANLSFWKTHCPRVTFYFVFCLFVFFYIISCITIAKPFLCPFNAFIHALWRSINKNFVVSNIRHSHVLDLQLRFNKKVPKSHCQFSSQNLPCSQSNEYIPSYFKEMYVLFNIHLWRSLNFCFCFWNNKENCVHKVWTKH